MIIFLFVFFVVLYLLFIAFLQHFSLMENVLLQQVLVCVVPQAGKSILLFHLLSLISVPILLSQTTDHTTLKMYHFLGQLVSQQLVLHTLLLHLLALLVIVDGQFLQSLKDLLHLSLGTVALHLQSAELSLDLVPITPGGGQELKGRKERETGREIKTVVYNNISLK